MQILPYDSLLACGLDLDTMFLGTKKGCEKNKMKEDQTTLIISCYHLLLFHFNFFKHIDEKRQKDQVN